MSKKALKKISKELKKASNLHGGQAKKIDNMLSKLPFKLRSGNKTTFKLMGSENKPSPNKFIVPASKLLFKVGKKLFKKLKNKKTIKKVKENKPLPASHPDFIRKSLKKQLSEPI